MSLLKWEKKYRKEGLNFRAPPGSREEVTKKEGVAYTRVLEQALSEFLDRYHKLEAKEKS